MTDSVNNMEDPIAELLARTDLATITDSELDTLISYWRSVRSDLQIMQVAGKTKKTARKKTNEPKPRLTLADLFASTASEENVNNDRTGDYIRNMLVRR